MKNKRNKNNENLDNNKENSKISVVWYPGHMAKTKRQIKEDLKLIDIVIELLDARIPISSQNPDIRDIVGNKKKIIALNKSDLADENANMRWKSYFEKKGIPAVIVDSNSGKGIKEITKKIQELSKSEMEKSALRGRTGKAIRIMVLGIPNVGKSSFINRISNKTSAKVGNKPGITVQKQWIKVANNIELLDTPGVLWPKFESEEVALNLSYTGTIKDEILEKTEIAFYLLKYLIKNHKKNLLERYNMLENEIREDLEENDMVMEVMEKIAKKRGAIMSGGKVDEEKIANILIEDFRSGKLGRITIETAK